MRAVAVDEIFKTLPVVSAVVVSRFNKFPVVREVDEISIMPAVFTPAPRVVAVLFVMARVELVLSFELMETTSLAVAGERVVDVLVQRLVIAPADPVIDPVHVKLPVVLATVQPVAVDPPATFTSTAPSACKSNLAEALITELVVEVRFKIPPAAPKVKRRVLSTLLSIVSAFCSLISVVTSVVSMFKP